MIDKQKKSDRIVKRCCGDKSSSIFVATILNFVKLINCIERKYKWVLLHKK